jgi:hypothetical protein
MIRFARSATKHSITHDQARYVIDHCGLPFTVPAPPEAAGGERLLFLGDDAHDVPLEVIALEVGETDLLVIHAMKMRSQYQEPYEEALPWRTTP